MAKKFTSPLSLASALASRKAKNSSIKRRSGTVVKKVAGKVLANKTKALRTPRLRVMTIVGTRPELIRLSRIISKLDQYCDHVLVHTGQNYDYELSDIFFKELGIRKPDIFLESAGNTGIQTIGQILIAIDEVFAMNAPDAVLILGDTNSALAAIAAKRRHIPIFHMEAGNRCFDMRVPEEINRKIVDHISDINMPYSTLARDHLIAEGIAPDQIIKTGSPLREVLTYFAKSISKSNILTKLNLKPNQYFVVSIHREENVDAPENLAKLVHLLNNLATRFSLPIIVSTHPRTQARLAQLKLPTHALLQFQKPFGFFDYVALQKKARCTLSDSGTISEESSILNFPALNLREVHERPEGMEEAVVMMVGLDSDRVFQALEILQDQARDQKRDLELVKDYAPLNISEKVLRILLSYTDFVNRKVWKHV